MKKYKTIVADLPWKYGVLGVGSKKSAFIDMKKAQEQFSIACKKYIESKPYQDMIKAFKCAGAF